MPDIRVSISGLANAGKTVFTTQLVAHLEHFKRALFDLGHGRTVTDVKYGPIDGPGVQPFPYVEARQRLLGRDPNWPLPTRELTGIRVEFTLVDEHAWVFPRSRYNLEIDDFPGELLVDLNLPDRSFEAWSEETQGFRVFWRWTSRSGRPPIPVDLQALIRRMARENPSWGEERIANELLLKLGLRVSPRTVRKYLPRSHDCRPTPGVSSQRWRTFVRNHAQAIIACDFCVAVTATIRLLYVFVVIEHATRKILHANVTGQPTAAWTLQQLRTAIPADHAYRFLIQDRDRIFSQQLGQQVQHLGLRVLKTPVRSPQANALCERLLGTLRRECLDFLIPLTENHVRHLLHDWALHYNQGRPHMALGPGIPQPPPHVSTTRQAHRHRLPAHLRVAARPILGGLHHEYRLEEQVA